MDYSKVIQPGSIYCDDNKILVGIDQKHLITEQEEGEFSFPNQETELMLLL
jgi:hypothetical protein